VPVGIIRIKNDIGALQATSVGEAEDALTTRGLFSGSLTMRSWVLFSYCSRIFLKEADEKVR
jgi:hypothetical protein